MIKLYEIEKAQDTRRFQTQLSIGKAHADFIMRNDTMLVWSYGNNGFDFYKYEKPYQIVTELNKMNLQQL